MKTVKINKVNYLDKFFFIIFMIVIIFTISGFTIPKNLEKKVKKQISQTFGIEKFQLNSVEIPTNTKAKIINNTNFHKIINNDKLLGYAIVDKAKSKSYDFDYLVLLNLELEIVNIKILIYREEHGNEISSKRYLKSHICL